MLKLNKYMYIPKDYKNLLGMKGFSDEALNLHFTLYEGYVKNVNSILEKIDEENYPTNGIERSEMKRRFGWEYNGMKLHEIYFESLSQDRNKINRDSSLVKKIEENYKSFENFLEEFKSTGLMRGIGWIALVKEEDTNNLFITWVDEHNTGIFADSKIILIMDIFEHAVLPDFGTKRADYINAFIENIDWKVVEKRFEE